MATVASVPAQIAANSVGSKGQINSTLDVFAALRDGAPCVRAPFRGPAAEGVQSAQETTLRPDGPFDIDVGGWLDATETAIGTSLSSATGITVPTDGLYLVAIAIRWPANATGSRVARLRVNGEVDNDIYSGVRFDTTSFVAGNAAQGIRRLTTGDVISMSVWQNSLGPFPQIETASMHALWIRS